jgi:hypothetical protein
MQGVERGHVKEHEIPAPQVIAQPDVRLQTASHAPAVHVVVHVPSWSWQVELHGDERQMTPHALPLPQVPPPSDDPASPNNASKSWAHPTRPTSSAMPAATPCLPITGDLRPLRWCTQYAARGVLGPWLARLRRPMVTSIAMLLAWGSLPPVAMAAASSEPPETVAQAKQLFAQGSALVVAGRYADALPFLQRSFEEVQSPNSELLIARCLRELGRLVDAQSAFTWTETEARRRLEDGEARYQKTAESAAAEGAEVRARLGTIRVRLDGVEPGAQLDLDGAPARLPESGEAVLFHEPGDAMVTLHSSSRGDQTQPVTVRAGAETVVVFAPPAPVAPPEPTPPVAPPAPSSRARPTTASAPPASTPAPSGGVHWSVPAAVTTGSLTLIGAGLFTGFGLASSSTYSALRKECGNPPSCMTAPQRSEAERGKRDELIANVSLAVGAAAGAATIAFVAVALSRPARARPMVVSHLRLRVGLLGVELQGEFP